MIPRLRVKKSNIGENIARFPMLIYIGIGNKRNHDEIIPKDLSMEQKLLLERNKAKEIKEEELTKTVNEKLKAASPALVQT